MAKYINPLKDLPEIMEFASVKQWEQAAWDMFTATLSDAKSVQKLRSILKLLVGSYEQKIIIKRAAAIKFLYEGASYRKISAELDIGSDTISILKKSIFTEEYRSRRSSPHKKREKKYSSLLPPSKKPRRDPMKRPHRHKSGTFYY